MRYARLLMTIVRHYTILAVDGKNVDLEAALNKLSDAVSVIEGCEGVELLRGLDQDHRFIFIEKWSDVSAHVEGRKSLDRSLVAAMMELVDRAPESAYFGYRRISSIMQAA